MPDPLAGQDGSDASADAPVTLTAADIEKVKAELQAEFEDRAKGFQRLISERDDKLAAHARELEELKTSGLSEDEREQLAQDKLRLENEALRGRLELSELAGQYGDEMPFYQRLLSGKTAEEQLKVLRELRTPAAPEVEVEKTAEIPDTDPNRPMRTPMEGTILADGSVMNDTIADRILNSVPVMASVTQRRLRPTD